VEVYVFDTSGKKQFSAKEKLSALPSSVIKLKSLANWKQTPGVQLLLLRLFDKTGKLLNQNTYWLENQNDFKSLASMPEASLSTKIVSSNVEEGNWVVTVQLQNNSASLAFFTRAQVLDQTGEEVLPSYWSDNYFTLMSGEQLTIKVKVDSYQQKPVSIRVSGWNVKEMIVPIQY
jgi:hypothetical protein